MLVGQDSSTTQGDVPRLAVGQTWDDVFDTFVADVLEPTVTSGASIVLASWLKNTGPYANGNYSGVVIASHAYTVHSWNAEERTLKLWNPHGTFVTVGPADLEAFQFFYTLDE